MNLSIKSFDFQHKVIETTILIHHQKIKNSAESLKQLKLIRMRHFFKFPNAMFAVIVLYLLPEN